jgi:transposase-like protein
MCSACGRSTRAISRHGILESYAGMPVTPSMTHEALAASLRAGAQSDPAVADAAEGASSSDRPLDEVQLRQAVIEFALRHGTTHAAGQFEHARRSFHGWLSEATGVVATARGQDDAPGDPVPHADAAMRRSDQFRRTVVAMAQQDGPQAAAEHFGVGRSTVYVWMRKPGVAPSEPLPSPPAAPSKGRSNGRRRRGLKAHLNALTPDVKLDRVFGAAVAVLEGESLDDVASRHGRKPVAARRWVQMALEHVDLGRLGLNPKHTRIERLRSHAHHIVPRLKRALARQKRSIAARS